MKIRGRLELAKFRLSHTSRLAKGIFISTWVWIPFGVVFLVNPTRFVYNVGSLIAILGFCCGIALFAKVGPELRDINKRHNNELNAIRRKHGIPEKLI